MKEHACFMLKKNPLKDLPFLLEGQTQICTVDVQRGMLQVHRALLWTSDGP